MCGTDVYSSITSSSTPSALGKEAQAPAVMSQQRSVLTHVPAASCRALHVARAQVIYLMTHHPSLVSSAFICVVEGHNRPRMQAMVSVLRISKRAAFSAARRDKTSSSPQRHLRNSMTRCYTNAGVACLPGFAPKVLRVYIILNVSQYCLHQ